MMIIMFGSMSMRIEAPLALACCFAPASASDCAAVAPQPGDQQCMPVRRGAAREHCTRTMARGDSQWVAAGVQARTSSAQWRAPCYL